MFILTYIINNNHLKYYNILYSTVKLIKVRIIKNLLKMEYHKTSKHHKASNIYFFRFYILSLKILVFNCVIKVDNEY